MKNKKKKINLWLVPILKCIARNYIFGQHFVEQQIIKMVKFPCNC